MAAKSGDVIFRAGEHNDTSDNWDDTALIEAYDRAISAIKNGGKNSSTKSKTGGKNRKQQSLKKKDKKKSTEQEQHIESKWHVGDSCRAVYSEDELIYDAIIISLDASSNTCVVKFCGYGNKEEQNLDDLLPPLSKKEGKTARQNGNQSGWPASPGQQSGDNEMEWTSGAQSPIRWQVSDLCLAPEQPSQHLHEAVINSFPTPYTCKVTFLRSRQRQQVDVSALKPSQPSHQLRHHHHSHHHHPYTSDQRYPLSGSSFSSYAFPSNYQSSMNYFPPPPPPPPMPPTFLPQHWPMANPTGVQPPATPSTQIPFAPMPPPPAPVNSSDVSHDNDALASMLMAWYLSGYHTGYYQAIQNLRHGTNTGANETQPVSTTETNTNKQDTADLPTT